MDEGFFSMHKPIQDPQNDKPATIVEHSILQNSFSSTPSALAFSETQPVNPASRVKALKSSFAYLYH